MNYIKKYTRFFGLILFFGVVGPIFAAEPLQLPNVVTVPPTKGAMKLPDVEEIMKKIAEDISDAVDAGNLALKQDHEENRKKLEDSARQHIVEALASLKRLQENYEGYQSLCRGSGGSGTDNANALLGDGKIGKYLRYLNTWGFERLKRDLETCVHKFTPGVTEITLEATLKELVQCGLFWEALPLYARQWHPETLKLETVMCLGISRLKNVLSQEAHVGIGQRLPTVLPSDGGWFDWLLNRKAALKREDSFLMDQALCLDHSRFITEKIMPVLDQFEDYIKPGAQTVATKNAYENIQKNVLSIKSYVKEVQGILSAHVTNDKNLPRLSDVINIHANLYVILEAINGDLVKVEAQKPFFPVLSQDQQTALCQLRDTPEKAKPWSLDGIYSLLTNITTSLKAILPSGDVTTMSKALAQVKAAFEKQCAEKRNNLKSCYPAFTQRPTPRGHWLLDYLGMYPTVDNIDWLANSGLPIAIHHISYSAEKIEGQLQIIESAKLTLLKEVQRMRDPNEWMLPDIDLTSKRKLITSGGSVDRTLQNKALAQKVSTLISNRTKMLARKYDNLLNIINAYTIKPYEAPQYSGVTIGLRKATVLVDAPCSVYDYLAKRPFNQKQKNFLNARTKLLEAIAASHHKLSGLRNGTENDYAILRKDLRVLHNVFYTEGAVLFYNGINNADLRTKYFKASNNINKSLNKGIKNGLVKLTEAATLEVQSNPDVRIGASERESKNDVEARHQEKERKIASDRPILAKDDRPVVPIGLQDDLLVNARSTELALRPGEEQWLQALDTSSRDLWTTPNLNKDYVSTFYEKCNTALLEYKKSNKTIDLEATRLTFTPDAFLTYVTSEYMKKKNIYDSVRRVQARWDNLSWWKKTWVHLAINRGWRTQDSIEYHMISKSRNDVDLKKEELLSLQRLMIATSVASKAWKQKDNVAASMSTDSRVHNATFKEIFGQYPIAPTA